MPKLGSDERPAVVRVRTQEKAEEILSICNEKGCKAIGGIEPDKVEDISDLERLLNLAVSSSKLNFQDLTPKGPPISVSVRD